jgi:hypothetical protein
MKLSQKAHSRSPVDIRTQEARVPITGPQLSLIKLAIKLGKISGSHSGGTRLSFLADN